MVNNHLRNFTSVVSRIRIDFLGKSQASTKHEANGLIVILARLGEVQMKIGRA